MAIYKIKPEFPLETKLPAGEFKEVAPGWYVIGNPDIFKVSETDITA